MHISLQQLEENLTIKTVKVAPNYIGAATSVTPEGLGLMHEIHFNHTSSDTDKILANPFDSSVVKLN